MELRQHQRDRDDEALVGVAAGALFRARGVYGRPALAAPIADRHGRRDGRVLRVLRGNLAKFVGRSDAIAPPNVTGIFEHR